MADVNTITTTCVLSSGRRKSEAELSRQGALSALEVLREIEAAIEADYGGCGGTSEDNFADDVHIRTASVDAVMRTIGTLTARQRGFVMTLAEFVHNTFMHGTPNPSIWKSAAAMTPQEFEQKRAEFIAGWKD